jgi:uncharacterized membrane protein
VYSLVTTAAVEARPAAAPARLQSLDILRGLVMVIMALDHVRDYLHADSMRFSPEDLAHTTVVLFFTRWITHFCAPVFVFLAGTSAYLAMRRKDPSAVGRFLLTRGLWLIVVEITLIQTATFFNFSYTYVIWQVMWAIGWSMIALSILRRLPWGVLLAVSVAAIAGHNLLDGVQPQQFGSGGWAWSVLHVGFSPIPLGEGHTALVVYPLIPWVAVMSAGYCFGRVMDYGAGRRRLLFAIGALLTICFFVVRGINGYGDPSPWTPQPSGVMTALSFLRVTKYPPSLDFLLMTLGPAILALGLLDRMVVSARHPLLVFGRVPLFYYIVHWYVLHSVALVLAWIRYGRFDFIFNVPPSLPISVGYPADYGYELWTVYVIWASIVFALYFVCRWFAGVKARSQSPILSYL